MRQKALRVFTLALPIIGAAAAVSIGLARVEWPNKNFWSPRMTVWAIVASGLAPVILTAVSELVKASKEHSLQLEDDIGVALRSALVLVSQQGAPWQHTGIQAFVLRGWPKSRERHVRIAKIRLSSMAASGLNWTKGKGVIGRCWEQNRSQVAVLDQPPFSDLARTTKEAWSSLPATKTFGLSYDEYQTIGTKYGTVMAVPMVNKSDKYIGCITLDTPPGVQIMQPEKCVAALMSTAEVVRRLVER